MSQLKLACAAIQAPFWLNLFVEDYISQFSFPLSFPGDVFGDFLPTLFGSEHLLYNGKFLMKLDKKIQNSDGCWVTRCIIGPRRATWRLVRRWIFIKFRQWSETGIQYLGRRLDKGVN